jgi:phosphoadenosine phosphosulfate reductase
MNIEKEKRAIEYLKSFEPEDEPYYLCYSGGKDSDCIRILAQLADVKHELHHSLTTVDSPETVKYVKSIPGIIVDKPEITMWQLIVKKKIPPTRLIRYCCAELKENGGKGRMKITGVRWEESNSRKETADVVRIVGKPKTTRKLAEDNGISFKSVRENGIALNNDNAETRRFVESCYRTTSTMVNPIVDWSTREVWEFLHYYGCKSNPEYECGRKRVGCVGCPMAGAKEQKLQFAEHPTYYRAYIRAFQKMVEAREKAGLTNNCGWKDGISVMKWWLEDDPFQIDLFETAQILEEMGFNDWGELDE